MALLGGGRARKRRNLINNGMLIGTNVVVIAALANRHEGITPAPYSVHVCTRFPVVHKMGH